MLKLHQGKQLSTETHKGGDKIMLFELDYRGHHPGYIQHLIRYWCEQEIPGQLDVLVSPKFMQLHSNIVDLARGSQQKNIKFVAITQEEEAKLFESAKLANSFTGRIVRAFQEWDLLRKYAVAL